MEKLNNVIEYIEKHITDELNLNDLAILSCCSLVSFHNMFSVITGMSVADYIRKRRLALAGVQLQQKDIRVIDVALKYGYDSPVSFARAFKAFHGVSPSEAKKPEILLRVFPKMVFQIYAKEIGAVKIVEKDEMFLSGFLVEPSGGNLWERYEKATEIYEQPELIDWTAYEVRFYLQEGERIFTACRQKEKVTFPNYELLSVPAALWAVFDIDFKIDQQPQYAQVYKWLDENKSSYIRMNWNANGRLNMSEFAIYWYDHQNKFGKERIMEMWIPLEKLTT